MLALWFLVNLASNPSTSEYVKTFTAATLFLPETATAEATPESTGQKLGRTCLLLRSLTSRIAAALSG